jgi:acyl carrier protein
MKYNNIDQIVLDTINRYLKEDKKSDAVATPDSILVDDLDIDSLDTIELGLQVEEEHGVEMPIEEMMGSNLVTVNDIITFVKNYHDSSAE